VRRAALVAAVLAACGPALPEPLPRILSASPQGPGVVPDAVLAEVRFSEPVNPAGIADGRLLALTRAADLEAVVAGVEAPGGLALGAPAVASRITPLEPLEPWTGYAIVVSSQVRSASGCAVLDPQGRRRPFTCPFDTGALPDR
jgi:hypothetical protein